MSDLISREAVLNLVLPWCADDDGSVGKMGDLREVLDDIENLPSVELEEQKKAAALEALEDVRTEITGNLESIIGKYDSNTKPKDMPSRKIERNNGRIEAIDIINRKIGRLIHGND